MAGRFDSAHQLQCFLGLTPSATSPQTPILHFGFGCHRLLVSPARGWDCFELAFVIQFTTEKDHRGCTAHDVCVWKPLSPLLEYSIGSLTTWRQVFRSLVHAPASPSLTLLLLQVQVHMCAGRGSRQLAVVSAWKSVLVRRWSINGRRSGPWALPTNSTRWQASRG